MDNQIYKEFPVVFISNVPLPGEQEKIIVLNKEDSIVAANYAITHCNSYFILGLNFEENNQYKDNKLSTDKKAGVLCQIVGEPIFIESNENNLKNSHNTHSPSETKKLVKMKVLVHIKTRIYFEKVILKEFIFNNPLSQAKMKFNSENIDYCGDQCQFKKLTINIEQNNAFYIAQINQDNVDDTEYFYNNIISNETNNINYLHSQQYNPLNNKQSKKYNDFNNDLITHALENLMLKFKNYSNVYDYTYNYNQISAIEDCAKKIDLIIAKFKLTNEELFEFLIEFDLLKRIKLTDKLIEKNITKNSLDKDIDEKVRESVEKVQKVYLLNEKAKEINRQLDSLSDEPSDIESMERKLESIEISALGKKKIKNEIKRLKTMSANSSDASLIKNYLDCIFSMPFGIFHKSNNDFATVSKILNQEHYGMEKVKERILQHLAVEFRNGCTPKSAILMVGPPGVGKTSLSRKIAQALDRKFIRISLGGVRDEADIRGHRRTYLGSMPGKIISAIRDCESANPVILLDEIDKIGHDFRGDPAAALLEVLDKEQNKDFLDHYLDIPFDLSKVLFICTANSFEGISRPLFDRMEIIQLSSYSDDEKLKIAYDYMIPEQMRKHNIAKEELVFDPNVVQEIIKNYTYEAGVRSLEEQISLIMRKTLMKILTKSETNPIDLPINVNLNNLVEFLGQAKYHYEQGDAGQIIGIVNGLAWNAAGGDMLSIECVAIELDSEKCQQEESSSNAKNKKKPTQTNGSIKYTGKLGEVMQESIQAAFSYIKANRTQLGVQEQSYIKSEIHIHVPEGATPKDGPSAGITIFIALMSLLLKKPVRKHLAMTGEITLTGRILPIGGLKEKILAAKRNGIKYILIPSKNKRDLEELPDILKQDIEFKLISTAPEALDFVFDK